MNKFRVSLIASLVITSGSALAFDHPTTNGPALAQEASLVTAQTGNQAGSALAGSFGSVTSFLVNDATGLAAGDSSSSFTPWGSYTYSETAAQVLGMNFTKDGHNFLVGVDTLLSTEMVLGVSVGTDYTESLQVGATAYQDRKGLIIAPYFGATISDSMMIDATIGYADYDNKWYSGIGVDTQNFDSEKWFAEANLNHFSSLADSTELMINGGLLWGVEKNEAFTSIAFGLQPENTVRILQMKLGATLSKKINNMTPYLSGTWNYDISTGGSTPGGICTLPACIPPDKYKQDFQLIAGANWQYKNGMTAGLEAGNRFGRKNLDEFVLNLNVRVDL